MSRLLFIDTETGGLNPDKHSLLSIGVVLWDNKQGIMLSDEFFVKSEHYIVTKEAQRINHFNIEQHELKAIDSHKVIQFFLFINEKFFDKQGIKLAGHNTHFDISFIRKLFLDNGRSYENVFSHRVVDTYSIMRFLCDSGKLDDNVLTSAKALAYFKIPVLTRHSALNDAKATLQLYSILLNL